jgi:hypothetical protein
MDDRRGGGREAGSEKILTVVGTREVSGRRQSSRLVLLRRDNERVRKMTRCGTSANGGVEMEPGEDVAG